MTNLILTADHLYVDTPKQPRVGPVGRVAAGYLQHRAPSRPLAFPIDSIKVIEAPEQNRVYVEAPGIQSVGRTNVHVGRPAQLSGRDQLRNMVAMFGRDKKPA